MVEPMEEMVLDKALQLPELLRDQQARVTQSQVDSQELSDHIQLLVENINTVNVQLTSELTTALATLPASLIACSAAQADVLALTIETSLLKLSLIQAHAFRQLYGHVASAAPGMAMRHALTTVAEKLHEQQLVQAEEEHMLAVQIDEYDQMLQVVDGHKAGFLQVVEDMTIVQQEIEEGRRDLRRLGWTGD
ncbi:hypothetical protein B0H21DRAFT_741262 [Amylocystis lapponica]|nr:hypothetical protein B0H21DRAFT_741262 [Amylocystis lapponica]